MNKVLVLILAFGFILRFWDGPHRYGIGYDGSRDAIVAFESARLFQLPLTGSFSSIGPITFGPWYYYYITLATYFFRTPWAPWIAIGLASFATIIVMYAIGVRLSGKRFGLILAFLAAISPAQIQASVSLQQHALIGFLSSVAILLLLLIIRRKHYFVLSLIWGFVVGVAMNVHFQAAGLITIPFLFFILYRKRTFIFPFMGGLFLSMVPILFFELNNHWFNTKNIIDYILIGQYRVWTSNRWLTFIGRFWPEFWSYVIGTPFIVSFAIMVGSGLVFGYRFLRKRLDLSFIILCISFIILLVMLRYYRGEKFFGYLQFFHPYLYIFTGYFFSLFIKPLRNPIFAVLSCLLVVYFMMPQTLSHTKFDPLTEDTYQRYNTLIKLFPNKKFSTYECKIYDTDRIQALLLFLYTNNLYATSGKKITVFNPLCNFPQAKKLPNGLVDLDAVPEPLMKKEVLRPITIAGIYEGTARWWIKSD